ncbi:MAG: FAD-dependent oxidoreductase [Bacteroidales bacterium]
MKVLIVGAGITGLTLANLLQQKDINTSIVEKSPIITDSQYSIALWPAGSRVLKGLGLYEKYKESSIKIKEFSITTDSGSSLANYNMSNILADYGSLRTIVIGEFKKILIDNFGREKIETGKTIKTILPSANNVEVMFSDGGVKTYDLVVGCDGKNSIVRKGLFQKETIFKTNWSGWAWRVDAAIKDYNNKIQEIWGKGKFLSIFPANNGIFCFGAMPDSKINISADHATSEFIHSTFGKLGKDAAKLLSYQGNIKDISFWNFTDVRQPKWYQNRVVLLGDACTSIIPVASLGATAGMESAAVLADELGRTDSHHINHALKLYYKRHLERINTIQKNSRKTVSWMFINGKFRTLERNLLIEMGSGVNFFKDIIDYMNEPI